MALTERYGSHANLMIRLMSAWDVQFRDVVAGDKFLVVTDDAMDPQVWQSAMAALHEKDADVSLAMHPRLAYHNDDPPSATIAAADDVAVVVALTTTALNSGTPAFRAIREKGRTAIWLMEENTTDILLEGGGRAKMPDILDIVAMQTRIAEIFDKGKKIHIKSEFGTDVVAEIGGYPAGYHVKRHSEVPFSRRADGTYARGTWPFGEIHVEPTPWTANGTLVWDTTAHFPEGRWRDPVTLRIEGGRVVAIEGGMEADEVKWYIDTHGDENSRAVGGEMALGTNRLAWPAMGMMRNDKKRYGAMHFGIGHGSDRNIVKSVLRLEGIIARVTIVVDDEIVVCDNGEILV